jgi:hypothetical protein
MECKHVKFKAEAFQTGLPNKLEALEKGAEQATKLLTCGFHKTLLVVLVTVDGRERQEFNPAFRGLSADMAETVEQRVRELRLPAEIGVIIVEISQPLDKSIHDSAGIGFRAVREAIPRLQRDEATAWVRELEDIHSAQSRGYDFTAD